MAKELIEKVVRLKQGIDNAKRAPMLQRANRIQAAVEDAVFLIEELVKEQVRLEDLLNEFSVSAGKGKANG